ncbi:HSP20-like chaperone [Auriculariales sp. MPI-PUGE-AT-0066]|nr:HSP20-like chaperone [Auriculariales sp. MPI-PUGE-AT-0066]
MSLSRNLLNELRPLFRVLEDPFFHQPAALWTGAQQSVPRVPYSAFNRLGVSRPAVDLHESGNEYVVEAELPGVKKDNIEVSIGDNGQSITIEGKVVMRQQPQEEEHATPTATNGLSADTTASATQLTQPELRELSQERRFVGSSMFTRTVWLPHPVESGKVSAKLEDGVLTVRVPKLQSETGSVKVPIE